MKGKKRIDRNIEIGKIYVRWNRKEIDGNAAMSLVHEIFKVECKEAWFKYEIKKEMMVN
jgi:hypothetical protein